MKRFLVLREGDRFELLLEKDDGALVLELADIAVPFDSFRGARRPDRGREALDQGEEIREGGSRIVWDRGELSGEVSPGAAFEVELRGQRLVGRYRFEGRGEEVAIIRAAPALKRSRFLLSFLGLLGLAGLSVGAFAHPTVRAQAYLILTSEGDVRLTETGSSLKGWAPELTTLGGEALPVLIPAAEEEARSDQSALRRSLLLLAAQEALGDYDRASEGNRQTSEVQVTKVPAAIFESLVLCLDSGTFPSLRIQALNLIATGADARCFALVIRHLRNLAEDRQGWGFSPNGGRRREAELALRALSTLCIYSGALVRDSSSDRRDRTSLQKVWAAALSGFEAPPPGSSSLGVFYAPAGPVSAEEVLTDLEAWLASVPEGLPEQIKAP